MHACMAWKAWIALCMWMYLVCVLSCLPVSVGKRTWRVIDATNGLVTPLAKVQFLSNSERWYPNGFVDQVPMCYSLRLSFCLINEECGDLDGDIFARPIGHSLQTWRVWTNEFASPVAKVRFLSKNLNSDGCDQFPLWTAIIRAYYVFVITFWFKTCSVESSGFIACIDSIQDSA